MNIKLTEAKQKAAEAQAQIEAARQQMSDAIRDVLDKAFTPMFEEYPFLGSIAWSQYTPYFNDGDVCVFSSSFTYPSLNSVKDVEQGTETTYGDEPGEHFASKAQEEIYGDYDRATQRYARSPNPDFDPAYTECQKAINEVVTSIAGNEKRDYCSSTPTNFDQALMQLFGDHATVTITREGIVVDECQHD